MKKIILFLSICFTCSMSQATPLTTGYIPYAKSGSVINDSVIYQNGVNIGIGSTIPQAKLDVAGGIRASKFNNTFYIDGTIYQRTSTSIQSIIDSVSASGAAMIVLSAGTYDMTSTVSWTNKEIAIIGDVSKGDGGVHLKQNDAFTGTSIFNPIQSSALAFNFQRLSRFENLYFEGNLGTGSAIKTSGFLHGVIRNVTITGFSDGKGIWLDTNIGVPVSDVIIDSSYIYGCDSDIYLSDYGESYLTQISITNSWLSYPSTNDGSNIYGEGTVSLSNVYLETDPSATAQSGIYANGALTVLATNTSFDIGGTNSAFDYTNNTATWHSSFIGCQIIPGQYTDSTYHPSLIANAYDGNIYNEYGGFKIDGNITTTTGYFYNKDASDDRAKIILNGQGDWLSIDSTSSNVYSFSDKNALSWDSGGEILSLKLNGDGSGGNVGIGTITPKQKLEVDGAIYIKSGSSPVILDNTLYNVGGNLYWNGTKLN